MNTSYHAQLKKVKREKKNNLKITIIYYFGNPKSTQKQASRNQVQKRKKKLSVTNENYKYRRKKLIRAARWTIFGAQDPSKVVDLNQLVVLISITTTSSINHRRIFIDVLWGLVGDLGRLVGRGTNSVGGFLRGVSGGALNSATIFLAASLRKDRSHSGC